MQKCLLALGSNLSNSTLMCFQLIEKAFELISRESVKNARSSAIYRSKAFPEGSGPDFANAAMRFETNLAPDDLLARLHAIENTLGRTRNQRWEARVCDIDLIAHGRSVLPNEATHNHWRDLPLTEQMRQTPQELILPHPRLSERIFVLRPLMDIAPDWVHPVSGKSIRDMLRALPESEQHSLSLYNP